MRKGLVTFTFLSIFSLSFIIHNETGSVDVWGQNNHTYTSKYVEKDINKSNKDVIRTVDIETIPKPSQAPQITIEATENSRIIEEVKVEPEPKIENQIKIESTVEKQIKSQDSQVIKSKDKKIVLLGDSITEGLSIYGFFPEAHIIGINSLNTISAREHTDNVVQNKPSKIFIMLGINDIWEGDSIDDFVIRYNDLIKDLKLRANGCEIYVESVLPISEAATERNQSINNSIIDSANEKIKEMCKQENVSYIDVSSKLKDEKGNLKAEYTNDGVHLINSYYHFWTDTLEEYMK